MRLRLRLELVTAFPITDVANVCKASVEKSNSVEAVGAINNNGSDNCLCYKSHIQPNSFKLSLFFKADLVYVTFI